MGERIGCDNQGRLGGYSIMTGPFANEFTDMLETLTPAGGAGKDYSELTEEQRGIVDEKIGEANSRDQYDAMVMMGRAINKLNKVVGGMESEDISIDYNPQTGTSKWRVRPKPAEEGGTDLGAAEKEYMVYQRKANAQPGDTAVYGFDYVRSVAATEP